MTIQWSLNLWRKMVRKNKAPMAMTRKKEKQSNIKLITPFGKQSPAHNYGFESMKHLILKWTLSNLKKTRWTNKLQKITMQSLTKIFKKHKKMPKRSKLKKKRIMNHRSNKIKTNKRKRKKLTPKRKNKKRLRRKLSWLMSKGLSMSRELKD